MYTTENEALEANSPGKMYIVHGGNKLLTSGDILLTTENSGWVYRALHLKGVYRSHVKNDSGTDSEHKE